MALKWKNVQHNAEEIWTQVLSIEHHIFIFAHNHRQRWQKWTIHKEKKSIWCFHIIAIRKLHSLLECVMRSKAKAIVWSKTLFWLPLLHRFERIEHFIMNFPCNIDGQCDRITLNLVSVLPFSVRQSVDAIEIYRFIVRKSMNFNMVQCQNVIDLRLDRK